MEPLHNGCATSRPPAAVIGLSSPGDSGDDADGPLGVRLMWQRVTLRSLCELTHGETSETSQVSFLCLLIENARVPSVPDTF